MVWSIIKLLMITVLISGCASNHPTPINVPKGLLDVYLKGVGDGHNDSSTFIEGKLHEQNTFGYVKPYTPVILPPQVRKVWIPDHQSETDTDVLVAGHWTYIMLNGPQWLINDKAVPLNINTTNGIFLPKPPQQEKI